VKSVVRAVAPFALGVSAGDEGISVLVGGYPAPVIDCAPAYRPDAGGITIGMPPSAGFTFPDAGDGGQPVIDVPIEVQNAFGQDTSIDLLEVVPGRPDGGC
jgi:hypothetical protein